MDYNISSWLKDELGLLHSAESDLKELIYHPTDGSLMRQMVNFLAKSTLCKDKYPQVGADEAKASAQLEYDTKIKEVDKLKEQLRDYIKKNISTELELSKLEYKHEQLSKNKENETERADKMSSIAFRSSIGLEQIANRIDKSSEYLDVDYLSQIYDDKLALDSDPVAKQQITGLDENLQVLEEKINIEHDSISRLILDIKSVLDGLGVINLGEKRPLTRPSPLIIDKTVPEYDDVEFKTLHDRKARLKEDLKRLKHSISELNEEYKTKKSIIAKNFEKLE